MLSECNYISYCALLFSFTLHRLYMYVHVQLHKCTLILCNASSSKPSGKPLITLAVTTFCRAQWPAKEFLYSLLPVGLPYEYDHAQLKHVRVRVGLSLVPSHPRRKGVGGWARDYVGLTCIISNFSMKNSPEIHLAASLRKIGVVHVA